MSRTFIFGLIFAFVLQYLATSNCAPVVSAIERESNGRQLDLPNDNDIPGLSPGFVPRQSPGFNPRRESQGILSRIVNFFKSILGIGTPSTIGPDGEEVPGTGGSERGILGFIRRTFGGLLNRFMSILGGNGIQPSGINPDAAEFPYRGSRQEPLRAG